MFSLNIHDSNLNSPSLTNAGETDFSHLTFGLGLQLPPAVEIEDWAAAIQELYDQHLASRIHLFESNVMLFNNALSFLDLAPSEVSFVTLDQFHNDSEEAAALLRDLLLNLPIEAALERFGFQAIFWAAVHCVERWQLSDLRENKIAKKYEMALEALAKFFNFVPATFKVAHALCLQEGLSSAECVFHGYQLVASEGDKLDSTFPHIRTHTLEQRVVGELRANAELTSRMRGPTSIRCGHEVRNKLSNLYSDSENWSRPNLDIEQVKRCINEAACFMPRELNWQDLNEVARSGNDYTAIRRVITWLKPSVVRREFGFEALIWAFSAYTGIMAEKHYSESTAKEHEYLALRKYLRSGAGVRTGTWERSGRMAWYLVGRSVDTALISAQYKQLLEHRPDKADRINLPNIMQPYLKSGADPGILSDFSLQPLNCRMKFMGRANEWKTSIETDKGELKYDIYIDSPIAFALLYQGMPVGVIAKYLVNRKTDCFCQLQGARGTLITPSGEKIVQPTQILHRFHLPRVMLFNIGYQISQESGVSCVAIRGSTNNTWTWRPQRTEDRELRVLYDKSKAEHDYDGTARKLGFRLGLDGIWYEPDNFKLNSDFVASLIRRWS